MKKVFFWIIGILAVLLISSFAVKKFFPSLWEKATNWFRTSQEVLGKKLDEVKQRFPGKKEEAKQG